MNFSQALDHIKQGRRATRSGWNGRGMFVFLVPGSSFEVNRAPLLGIYPAGTRITYHAHIDMRTADGQIVPWFASQTDLLADDWRILLSDSAGPDENHQEQENYQWPHEGRFPLDPTLAFVPVGHA